MKLYEVAITMDHHYFGRSSTISTLIVKVYIKLFSYRLRFLIYTKVAHRCVGDPHVQGKIKWLAELSILHYPLYWRGISPFFFATLCVENLLRWVFLNRSLKNRPDTAGESTLKF